MPGTPTSPAAAVASQWAGIVRAASRLEVRSGRPTTSKDSMTSRMSSSCPPPTDDSCGVLFLGMFILAVLVERWVSIKFVFNVSSVKLDDKAYIHWDKLSSGYKGIQEAYATLAGLHVNGLGCSPFAHHYSGYLFDFFYVRLLRCFTSPTSPPHSRVSGLRRRGCPIRIPPDLRSLAPPRGFSQLAASFFAVGCLGILRVPFSPYSPLQHCLLCAARHSYCQNS